MAINLNFNFGSQGFGGGCPCQGSSSAGLGGDFGAPAGFNPMGGLGGFGANPMNGQLTNMLLLSMMATMTQLMGMLAGGSGVIGGPGQFGGGNAGGNSPLGDFLGTSGGGNTNSFENGGFSPTGSGASLGPADGSTSPKTKKFIDLALAQQGKPYVFGAAGPNAFDCSGLVSWALKQAGVKGGRTTAAGLQDRYKSTAITRKEDLRPGDLVFFWSPNNRGIPRGKASHVEIYLGNGKTMGTDSPREGAKVEPINWSSFIGGARVPELQQ